MTEKLSDEARREAERRWPGVGRGVERETLDRATRYGFVSGAEWQAIRDAERIEALEAELAEYQARDRKKITITYGPGRCMACGLPDHQCPTGGRLLR